MLLNLINDISVTSMSNTFITQGMRINNDNDDHALFITDSTGCGVMMKSQWIMMFILFSEITSAHQNPSEPNCTNPDDKYFIFNSLKSIDAYIGR